MTEPKPRIELIQAYDQTKANLLEAVSHGRPICPVLAGDLMALAERLSIAETTQDFIRELSEKQNHKPSGSFKGVTGF